MTSTPARKPSDLMVLAAPHSDRDLERRVVSFLHDRHVPGLRHLNVSADNGTVFLRGRVNSFYEMQLCQNCCQRVAGVVRLVNEVTVA